ncbi:MAG: type VI secretion system tube protein TssD [Ferruginibacter sp.]
MRVELLIENQQFFAALDGCTYSFSQNAGITGQIISGVNGGEINFLFRPFFPADTFILEWMLDPVKRFSGTITFKEKEDSQDVRTLEFTNAACISYTWNFTATNQGTKEFRENMTENVIILAESITVGNAVFPP